MHLKSFLGCKNVRAGPGRLNIAGTQDPYLEHDHKQVINSFFMKVFDLMGYEDSKAVRIRPT